MKNNVDSCLNCKHFHKCPYENKRGTYKCKSWYKKPSVSNSVFDADSLLSGGKLILPEDIGGGSDSKYSDTEVNNFVKSFNAGQNGLYDLVLDSLKNESPVARDLRVDDGDLKEAPNYYAFMMEKPWSWGIKPFARQLWAITKLFAEYCPDCSDKKFWSDIHVPPVGMKPEEFNNHTVWLHLGKCPKCKGTRSQFVKQGKLKFYQELDGLAGQRSGKSLITSTILAYLWHKFAKMQKPSQALGLATSTTLTFTCLALTKNQVGRNLWMPFLDNIRSSPWFKEYHAMLKHYGRKYGEELYKEMDTFLHYRHRGLLVHPDVPNARTLRGATRVVSIIDEIGWFDAEQKDKITISADAVYDAMDSSMWTVRGGANNLMERGFNNIYNGYMIAVSSPASVTDKICSLVKAHEGSSTNLTFWLPTWEMNPTITRKLLEPKFREDPIAAERNFGCNPPVTNSPFYPDAQVIESCFDKGITNRVTYEYIHTKSTNTNAKHIFRSAKVNVSQPSIVCPSVMALDAGVSNNSFSLAIGHREKEMTVFDTFVEIIPEIGKSRIHYQKTYEKVMKPIIEALNVKAVFADRWNSLFILHAVEEDFGIIAEQFSVKYSDFAMHKSFAEAGRIKYPALEGDMASVLKDTGVNYPNCYDYRPMSHLALQMMTVQDTGRTVIKGQKRTDDTLRATVLACHYLLDNEWVAEHLIDTKQGLTNHGTVAIGMGNGQSGGVFTSLEGYGIVATGVGAGAISGVVG